MRFGSSDYRSRDCKSEAARVSIVIFVCVVIVGVLAFSSIGRYCITYVTSAVRLSSIEKRVYEKMIRPTAKWVRTFHEQEGRLPSEQEIKAFIQSHPEFESVALGVSTNSMGSMDHLWRPGRDFVVWADVGDWNLYYNSWDGREWKEWTD